MKNYTGMKIAKKYEAGIEEIYKDIDGVWAHAAAGYYFESMDTHTAHEDNQKDLYKVIQTLAPCECEECENMKAADEAEAAAEEAADFIDEHVEVVVVRSEAAIEAPEATARPLSKDDADISVWVGSLGAYNSGYLIGEWIALPKTDDELNEIYDRINKNAERATGEPQEELDIMDTNINIEGLTAATYGAGIDKYNELAELLEDLHESDKAHIEDVNEVTGDIEQAIEHVSEALIIEDVSTDRELGEQLHALDMLHVEIPAHLENYIDFESIGRDYRLGGEFTITSNDNAVCVNF